MVVLITGLSHYAVHRNSLLVARVTVVLDLLEEVTLNTIMRSRRPGLYLCRVLWPFGNSHTAMYIYVHLVE